MPSVYDWAAKAAERIKAEPRSASVDRIAAIIATFADPLLTLLREAYRSHYHFDGDIRGTDCCPQCDCECWPVDPEPDFEPVPNRDEPCTCGADAWNARIDAALAGSAPSLRKRAKSNTTKR